MFFLIFVREVTTFQQYIFESEPEIPEYKKLGLANANKKQELKNYNCSNELEQL